ncbi:GvpL/GvpF family gas vesicle protein [Streptomyces hiroshimensis]|uniref:Gas vesicle protein n=1 Tax=Streptomyces hiroshimensis TaxID=66424 RepID=A0ABQ2Z277_9ACTN|nr:GvpL/GvpF family gas vesicle protein [Streptomyces hiroshimensis]GGY02022.1 gas vesicle protein [Streptomyces hiroshimensis]
MNRDRTELLYAYAVLRDTGAAGDGPGTVTGATGVAGEPVRAVREGGLVVLVGSVPAAEFDEEGLRERLEDLAWLEHVARGHQRVVDAASAGAPCVLPLRLATVYRDEAGVRRMLTARHTAFGAALDRLEGRAEWGVKIHTVAEGAAEAPAATPPPPPPLPGPRSRARPRAPRAATSGRDYLRQRAAERQAREEEWRHVDEAARGIHAALATLAEETRLYPPQNPRFTGHPGRNVLNAAYLVPRERGPAFTAAVAGLAGRAPQDGLRVELTGPWAPYSFVAGEPSREPAHDTGTA